MQEKGWQGNKRQGVSGQFAMGNMRPLVSYGGAAAVLLLLLYVFSGSSSTSVDTFMPHGPLDYQTEMKIYRFLSPRWRANCLIHATTVHWFVHRSAGNMRMYNSQPLIREMRAMMRSLLFYRTCNVTMNFVTDDYSLHDLTHEVFFYLGIVIKLNGQVVQQGDGLSPLQYRTLYETNKPGLWLKLYNVTEYEPIIADLPDSLTDQLLLKASMERVMVDASAAMHIDTDTLVLSDICDLWIRWVRNAHGRRPPGGAMVQIAPEISSWYAEPGRLQKWNVTAREDRFKNVWYGFNSGVIVYDLDEMRAVDWTSMWKPIMKKMDSLTTPGDQDVWNLALDKHYPDRVRQLPLEWNFQLASFLTGTYARNRCAILQYASRLKILHGNDGSFASDEDVFCPLFHLFDSSKEDYGSCPYKGVSNDIVLLGHMKDDVQSLAALLSSFYDDKLRGVNWCGQEPCVEDSM